MGLEGIASWTILTQEEFHAVDPGVVVDRSRGRRVRADARLFQYGNSPSFRKELLEVPRCGDPAFPLRSAYARGRSEGRREGRRHRSWQSRGEPVVSAGRRSGKAGHAD